MSNMAFMEKMFDGVDVEWKALGEVGDFIRGKRFVKKDMISAGAPCIHYGEMYTHYGIWADKTKSFVSNELVERKNLRVAEKDDVILVAAGETIEDIGLGTAWLGNEGVVIHDACFFYKSSLNPTYVAYFTRTKQFHDQIKKHISSGKISAINAKGLSKAIIPIPCPDNPEKSLEIQTEIVLILDAFTELTTELTTELSARKKQYNYYRDQLLSFEEGEVEWKALGEVCHTASGGTPSKSKKEYWDKGNIPWLKSESCNNESVYSASNFITELGLNNSSTKILGKDTTLIALVGATIFKTAYLEFEATTNQNIASIKSKDSNMLLDKFVFYYITNLYEILKFKMRNYGMLNLTTLRQFKLPIPYPDDPEKSLAEQARIVAILDKFDTLTNSISEGLPREIELRQKQYEYYRDLLLSFPKAEAVA